VVLRKFERRLERMVEGTFARVFKSGLTPLEIGKRITRVMDTERSVGVSRTTVVPNHFVVYVSPDDYEQFSEVASKLVAELEDAARDHASDQGYSFMGPVMVELSQADSYPTGDFEVVAKLKEGASGRPPGSLVLPTDERIRLGDTTFRVGRVSGNELVLSDPNVSRHHAEVRAIPGGYQLVDLQSTNGTKVNGAPISEHRLLSGDVITFGATVVSFESS